MMDGPKINLRAWEPLEKRKKKAEAKQKSRNEEQNAHNAKDHYAIESKKTAPNYYEYKFNKDLKEQKDNSEQKDNIEQPNYKIDQPKYNIEIIDKINKKYNKSRGRHSSNSNNGSNLVKFVLAGIGAIFTGIVFGYILLHYFLQPIFNEESSNINSQNSSYISINNNQPTTSQMFYPSETIYLIQAGVFSEISGAEVIANEQKQLGRAAVVSGDGPYHVFIGIGRTKEEAVQIKNMIDQENAFYVKEYLLSEYNFTGGTEQDFSTIYSFLAAGDKLTELLSQGTSLALLNSINTFNYDEIEKAHQQLLLEAQNVKLKLNSENYIQQQEIIDSLTTDLYYAVTALNAYKKNPNTQYLWSIQELLIKYELKYQELTKI